ncbi:MAG: hypothetical protein ACYDIC_01235 [Desulfobaccales bacterium]
MIYIFTFPDVDEHQAELDIPLLFHGQHLERNGWDNGIEIVFMQGYDKFSPEHKDRLRASGYKLTDKVKETEEIKRQYPEAARLSDYICYTFLRGLLLARMVARGEAVLPALVVGGDVIFTADPAAVLAEVRSRTFVLQGCSDFVVINDRRWLEVYQEEFARYIRDPQGYSEHARVIRDHPHKPDRDYCNLSAYAIPLRHEQDLHQYLIACGKLPQDTTREIYGNSQFYWIQNPLFPDQWFREQADGLQKQVTERPGGLWIGEKQIPFFHLQNHFSWYCYLWRSLDKLGLSVMSPFFGYNRVTGEQIFLGKAFSAFLRRLPGAKGKYSRRSVCDMIFRTNPRTRNFYITDIINSRWAPPL